MEVKGRLHVKVAQCNCKFCTVFNRYYTSSSQGLSKRRQCVFLPQNEIIEAGGRFTRNRLVRLADNWLFTESWQIVQ